jgi:metal-sulfur cluster biosynthetic enzyme
MSAWGDTWMMRDYIACNLPSNSDGAAVLEQLAQVLDPELDESIIDLGFVRSVQLQCGHADVSGGTGNHHPKCFI